MTIETFDRDDFGRILEYEVDTQLERLLLCKAANLLMVYIAYTSTTIKTLNFTINFEYLFNKPLELEHHDQVITASDLDLDSEYTVRRQWKLAKLAPERICQFGPLPSSGKVSQRILALYQISLGLAQPS